MAFYRLGDTRALGVSVRPGRGVCDRGQLAFPWFLPGALIRGAIPPGPLIPGQLLVGRTDGTRPDHRAAKRSAVDSRPDDSGLFGPGRMSWKRRGLELAVPPPSQRFAWCRTWWHHWWRGRSARRTVRWWRNERIRATARCGCHGLLGFTSGLFPVVFTASVAAVVLFCLVLLVLRTIRFGRFVLLTADVIRRFSARGMVWFGHACCVTERGVRGRRVLLRTRGFVRPLRLALAVLRLLLGRARAVRAGTRFAAGRVGRAGLRCGWLGLVRQRRWGLAARWGRRGAAVIIIVIARTRDAVCRDRLFVRFVYVVAIVTEVNDQLPLLVVVVERVRVLGRIVTLIAVFTPIFCARRRRRRRRWRVHRRRRWQVRRRHLRKEES